MKKVVITTTLLATLLSAVEVPKNEIRSVRGILGSFEHIEHATLQVRAGYINLDSGSDVSSSAFGVGGHADFDTRRWYGMKLGVSLYTVQGLGLQDDNPLKLNPDFFDDEGESFAILSESYLDAEWGETKIKAGRQTFNSPHADSDDIRMMPNYFNVYRIHNSDIENLTLHAGLITEMAGWENGVDSSKFVDVSEVLGAEGDTDGIYFASGVYEGIDNISLSLWYYYYDEIATVLYAEAGYSYSVDDNIELSFGLQYDTSTGTGNELLGELDSNTFGASLEINIADMGLTTLMAYNYDDGDTGAMGLSLGGGAFFTSMEDQTLDAIGAKGSAWIFGMAYNFEKVDIEGFVVGMAYGEFVADDTASYDTNELDIVAEYSINEKLSLTLAYASIDDSTKNDEDYDQFRIITNYSF